MVEDEQVTSRLLLFSDRFLGCCWFVREQRKSVEFIAM